MDITQRKTGIEQRSDNTYVRKPKIVEEIPFNFGTVLKIRMGIGYQVHKGECIKISLERSIQQHNMKITSKMGQMKLAVSMVCH